MRTRRTWPALARALAGCLLLLLAVDGASGAATGTGAETWIVQGRTYEDVRVGEVTPATVTIFHREGISQLELTRLPPELQARFHFDPERRDAWQREADAGLAATRARQKQWQQKRLRNAMTSSIMASARTGSALAPTPVTFARSVDLRPVYQKNGLFLKDQGRRPSCSIFAVVGALEYEYARRDGRVEPLSEEFLIWAVRALQPGIPIDDGYHFEEVISALQNYGVPRQALMPNTFGRRISDIRPSPQAMIEAATRRHVVPVWFRPDDPELIERLVASLNHQTPVVIGLRWPHWRTLERNALLRDQKPLAGAGHAVTLIGYRSPEGKADGTVFLFRNSYGAHWGTGGCGFVAAEYLRDNLIAAFQLRLTDRSPALAGQ